MKPHWKIAGAILCVAAVCGAAFWWLAHKQADEQKLAAQVKATRTLAEQGDAKAQSHLGYMYRYGQGVPLNNDEALRWYRKSADQGYAAAEFGVGNMYFYGLGVLQDYTEATRWCRKAADQGYAPAQYSIGANYFYGYGVEKDDSLAVFWYRKAADQGYAWAETNLGYMYSQGRGVPKDKDEANRWYRKAADHGDEYAQRALGLRTCSLTTWRKYSLFIGLMGGLLFTFSFQSKGNSSGKQKWSRWNLMGPLVLIDTGMDWYQCSKFGVFHSAAAAIAFTFATMFLGGVIVALLIHFVLPRFLKFLPIFAAILFALLTLSLCVIAHFDMRVLTAVFPRLLSFSACPLGIAITSAFLLWRARNHPEAEVVPVIEASSESTDGSGS
ncbi:MAG: tetratricopeptide repeat protein [Terracidiphilus sp.]